MVPGISVHNPYFTDVFELLVQALETNKEPFFLQSPQCVFPQKYKSRVPAIQEDEDNGNQCAKD